MDMEMNKAFLSKKLALKDNKIYLDEHLKSGQAAHHIETSQLLATNKRGKLICLQRKHGYQCMGYEYIYYIELQLLFWDRYQGILKITSQTHILQCVQRHINALAVNSLMYRAIDGVAILSLTLTTHTRKHKRLSWSGCLVQRGAQWQNVCGA